MKINDMDIKNKDRGIMLALVQHFDNQILPRVIEIKQKLDNGDTVNEFDIEYLGEVLHETKSLLPYLDRHPEYEPLFAKIIHYYKLITDEAIANEK